LGFEVRDEVCPTDSWSSANGGGCPRTGNRRKEGAVIGVVSISGRQTPSRKVSAGLPPGIANFLHRIDKAELATCKSKATLRLL